MRPARIQGEELRSQTETPSVSRCCEELHRYSAAGVRVQVSRYLDGKEGRALFDAASSKSPSTTRPPPPTRSGTTNVQNQPPPRGDGFTIRRLGSHLLAVTVPSVGVQVVQSQLLYAAAVRCRATGRTPSARDLLRCPRLPGNLAATPSLPVINKLISPRGKLFL
ncbi:hypothetical protein EYF80_058958 [Liparis tanakae]|uniref:Uncharacterized protein n=1 Tax=Liparis tanakae TaxID=230148 RepID=A0A4Z2EQJ9_9TELE|nr:hypothetical protein EYF80_058958 [Liparis tanakae]